MKDTLFLIFKQIGERSSLQDPRVAYIIGTNRDAQEECNRLNKAETAYHYFMEVEEDLIDMYRRERRMEGEEI